MTPRRSPRRPRHHRTPRTPERKGASGNPAMIRGAVVAVLSALTMLGVGWAAKVDPDTATIVVGALVTLVPLVQGWWTRRAVVPVEATLAYVDDRGVPVAGEAASMPTGEPLPAELERGAYVVTRVPLT